jgi:hypothetical protein
MSIVMFSLCKFQCSLRMSRDQLSGYIDNDVLARSSESTQSILVLDDIHNYPDWKNHIKGLYDHYKGQRFIFEREARIARRCRETGFICNCYDGSENIKEARESCMA